MACSMLVVSSSIWALSESIVDSIIWQISAWWSSKRPVNASCSTAILPRIEPRASCARTFGSRCPPISASSIARPDTPWMLAITELSLICESSKTFSSRCLLRVRSWVNARRYRVRSRSRRIGLGGTKLARAMPRSATLASQIASSRSVFGRPGRYLTCLASSSQHSNSSSSRKNGGFQ